MGDGVDEDLLQSLDNGLGAFFVHDDGEQFPIVMENRPVARVLVFDDVVHGSGVWMECLFKRGRTTEAALPSSSRRPARFPI